MNRSQTLLFLLLLVSSICAYAFTEKISSFVSDITITPDGYLNVHETITVDLEKGRRGIFRDFPTRYDSSLGCKTEIGFSPTKVTRNGLNVLYEVQAIDYGVRIKIGDASKPLAPGTYVYEIFYTTDSQIGFFENHDELYWNVTGNGWGLPMESVTAHLHLPEGAMIESVHGYTGYYGAKGQNYTATIVNAREATWKTTKALDPEQGITIVATWQKGIVQNLNPYTWLRFIKDNCAMILLLIGFLIFTGYACYAYIILDRKKENQVIIPLFNPPSDLTPAQVRYLYNYGYDEVALACEIMDMGVHGHVSIEKKNDKLFSYYEITKNETVLSPLKNTHQLLIETIFSTSNTFRIGQRYHDLINLINSALENRLARIMASYFDLQEHYFAMMIVIGIATFGAYFLFGGHADHPLFWLILFFYLLALIVIWGAIKCYSPEGRKLLNEIAGLRLYLVTAEQDRLDFISTPPVRTPELYEKLLPYAVALGVERQWTTQFASVFARLEEQGKPYVHRWHTHDLSDFYRYTKNYSLSSSDRGSTLNHTRNTNRPGSSSGARGSGSSGRGGGGGGGGVW